MEELFFKFVFGTTIQWLDVCILFDNYLYKSVITFNSRFRVIDPNFIRIGDVFPEQQD